MTKREEPPATTVVTLELEAPPGADVFVVGDFPDWSQRHRADEIAPGRYRVPLTLVTGLYRYKWLVNGAWTHDPRANVVDRAEGFDNGVLAVNGASPPVCFAPDRRHVGLLEDGRLLVRAELVGDVGNARARTLGDGAAAVMGGRARGGADATHPSSAASAANAASASCGSTAATATLLTADGREVVLPMEVIGRRADRTMLALDVVPPLVPVAISVAGAGPLPLPPARTPLGAPPSWLRGAVVYGVFLDRWRRGASSPRERRMLGPRTPSTPFVFYGGDLDGVRESLSYIADLGVSALAITPVQLSESPHRYDAVDMNVVDPRVGGERALAALVDACHARGLKLIVDVSLTHVSERHAAFADVLAHQAASPFASWFRVRRFPVVKRDASTFEHYYNCPNLPWLRLEEGSPARAHVLAAVERLVGFGVDGLRLDAMDDAPASLWGELRARVRTLRPELLLLGEIVGDNLWTRAEERGADVATDFRIRDAFVRFFATRTMDAAGFSEALAFASHRTGAFDPPFRVGFLDNHDTARFLSLADERRLRCALATLLFLEETAWITYGTEAHLAARRGESALDAAWPERLPMPEPATVVTATLALLARACTWRRAMTTLQAGPPRVVAADGARLTLARTTPCGRVFELSVDVGGGEPAMIERET